MTAQLPSRTATPSLATLTLKGKPLVEAWLDEQHDLSAVERFARKHERGDLPTQAKFYRELIPLTKPGAGQQYAFDVDLDACTGCKACVTACHNLNGLDDDEAFRDVGLLIGGSLDLPVIQHVTSACHHCLEPACLEGCPVKAYEKDEVTGIVKHLDDQCIGCQYCILKCPYDVPKYNASRGIVRKCDMCGDRLKVGEAPACVQACPNQAIRINIIDRSTVKERAAANVFLQGAPEPGYTLPTTTYHGKRALPQNMLPADEHAVSPQHAHPPLVIMLVLTQLSVGAFVVEGMLRWLLPLNESNGATTGVAHAVIALALGLLALGASTMHLGRPMYAFRAIIGLRTSWLSREIIVFGGFAGAAAAYAAATWLLPGESHEFLRNMLNLGAIVAGMVGVFCSAMIYHDTRRAHWTIEQTATKFALTLLWLGACTTLLTTLFTGAAGEPWIRPLSLTIATIGTAKLLFESLVFRHLRNPHNTPHRRTARLLVGPLARLTAARFIVGIAGGVMLPLLMAMSATDGSSPSLLLVSLILLSTLAGELIERTLFFAAVVAPKMPGGAHP